MKKGIILIFILSLVIIAVTYITVNADTSIVGDSGFTRESTGIKQSVPTDSVVFGNSSSLGMIVSGNTLRSQDEITLNIKGTAVDFQTLIMSEPTLISYWKMDNDWLDAKGTAPGTATGATFSTDARYGATSGNFNGASYVNVSDATFPSGNQPRSIFVWIKSTQASSSGEILDYGTIGGGNRCLISVHGGLGKLMVGNHGDALLGTTTINDGSWHYVGFTYNGTIYKLYVDGSIEQFSLGNGYMYTNTILNTAMIGSNINNSLYYTGLIDELTIYNSVLSDATISSYYHVGGKSHLHIENSTTGSVDVHLHGDVYFGVIESTKFTPSVADGATSIAHTFSTDSIMSTVGAKILSIQNANIEKSYIDKDGKLMSPEIIGSTASTGDLRLSSTSHATKGHVLIGLSSYDEFLDMFSLYNLTGNRVLVSDVSKNIIASNTTDTEIGYISGVTSAIQTQLDTKATLGSSVRFTNISSNNIYAGANANLTDFPNAKLIASTGDTGETHSYNIGVVGEAVGAAGGTLWGVGVYGVGSTNVDTRSAGVLGDGKVIATGDNGSAVGVRGYATDTHTGGLNIGLYANSSGGSSNYALYMAGGDMYSTVAQTFTTPGLTISGPFTANFAFKTISSSPYTIASPDYMVACHTKTNITIKLPAAAASNIGRALEFKKTTNNNNKVFLNATTGQLIDSIFSNSSGMDTFNEANKVVSDGVGWKFFGMY